MADKPNFTNHTGDDYESGVMEINNPCNLCGSQRCYPEYCVKLHPELKQMCDLMCPEPESEDKGFEIRCLNCGSTDCVVSLEYDIEKGFSVGSPYLVCQNCYQSNA